MSRHLVTYLPEDLSIGSRQAPPQVSSNVRNRGNNELSKRSNCSVHQGTKIGLAEEQPGYLKSPESELTSPCTLPKQSYTVSLKEVVYPPAKISTFPSNIQAFLPSIPGSLGLKIVPRRYIKHSLESLPRYCSNFPKRVQSSSPGKLEPSLNQ